MTRKSCEVEFRIVKRVRVEDDDTTDVVKEAFRQLLAIDQEAVESYRVDGWDGWHTYQRLEEL